MGLYMYTSDEDRIEKRKVTDPVLNYEFQEALKYDSSLMIEEHTIKVTKGIFKRTIQYETLYSVYHETPAHDGSSYQARLQFSGSGNKQIVVAYLHGIINGSRSYKATTNKK